MARTLRQGMQGEDVRALQQFLASQGFDVGKIDADFGRRTRQALIEYQRSAGLVADGVAGAMTLESMRMPPVPQPNPLRQPTPPMPPSSGLGMRSQVPMQPSLPAQSGLGMQSQPSPMSLPQRSGIGMPNQPPPDMMRTSSIPAKPPMGQLKTPAQMLIAPYQEWWTGKSADELATERRNNDVTSGNSPLAAVESYVPEQMGGAPNPAEVMARGIVENMGGRFDDAFAPAPEPPPPPPEPEPTWLGQMLQSGMSSTWDRIHDPDFRRRMERDGLAPNRRRPTPDPLVQALTSRTGN